VRRRLLTPVRLELDLLILIAILLAWQAIRIPLEGSTATAMDNARALLDVERALHLDVEAWFLDRGSQARELFVFAYQHVHLPMLFGFLAVARLAAPARYPFIRLAFALSFVPAAVLIGLLPVAPPRWLPELGSAGPPTDAELSATTTELLQNSTAAIASQHFGYAFLIAAGSLWLWPRSRLAWAAALYPAFVFSVVLVTANHYALDCLIGALTIGFGAAAAAVVARGLPRLRTAPPLPAARVAGLAAAAAVLASFGVITAAACSIAVAAALALARWLGSREARDAFEAADRA
jgi:PAP2 superfamily protein